MDGGNSQKTPMKPKTPFSAIFLPGVFCALQSASPAADLWWNGPSGGLWNAVANWSTDGTTHVPPAAFPTVADNVYFNVSSVTGDQLVLLDNTRSVRSLNFTSPGSVGIQGSGSSRTLNIGGDGSTITPETSTIYVAAGAGPASIGLPSNGTGNGVSTRIQTSQTWTNESSNVFTVHNSIQSTVAGTHVLTLAGSGDFMLAVTAPIANGTGVIAITKKGSGSLTMRNNSTYSGVTRIEGGTIIASTIANGGTASSIGNSAADASNLVFNGGTLHWTGTANAGTDRGFTLESNGGTIRNDSTSVAVRFGGAVTGPGSLTKVGAGSLALSSPDSDYAGKTHILEGSISARTAAALGASGNADNGTEVSAGASLNLDPNSTGGSLTAATWTEFLTLDGGTLRNGSLNNTWQGNITLSATSTLSAASGTTLTIESTINGTGGLNKTDSGTIYLKGANTYSGVTTISGGTLRVDSLASGGSASGIGNSSAASSNLVFDGGTLFLSGTANVGINRGFTLNAGGGTIRKDSGILRFSGIITGAGEFRKTGSGTLALSNEANNFTGKIIVSQGIFEARKANVFGATGTEENGIQINSGASLYLDSGGSEGSAADMTISETAILNGGTLRSRSYNNTWTGAVILSANSSLSADTGASLTINSSISESVASTMLSKTGTGTVTLNAVNSFTGTTRVTAGTLNAAVTGGLNSSTNLALEGGTFRLGSNEVFNDLATLAFSGGTLDMNGFNETIGGAVQLTVDSSLLMTGTSTLRLGASSSETWQGMLMISGWDGLVTGGGDDQIFFGNDASGLTTDQLAWIRFIDPTGLGSGTYDARILSTGEIVPGSLIPEPSAFLLAALTGIGAAARRKR